MQKLLRLLLPALLASAGCKEGPVEPCGLEGGETITYALEGITQGPLTIEGTETAYVLSAPSTGLPPQEVGLNLRDGRTKVKAWDIGVLWLEPSQRRIGGQTLLGEVVAEETKAQRPAFKVSERNGHVFYWYCQQTGFLLERRVSPSGPTLSLVSSTIPGL